MNDVIVEDSEGVLDVVVVIDIDVVAVLSTMEGLSMKTCYLLPGYMAI